MHDISCHRNLLASSCPHLQDYALNAPYRLERSANLRQISFRGRSNTFPMIGNGRGPGGRGPRVLSRYEYQIDEAMPRNNVNTTSMGGTFMAVSMMNDGKYLWIEPAGGLLYSFPVPLTPTRTDIGPRLTNLAREVDVGAVLHYARCNRAAVAFCSGELTPTWKQPEDTTKFAIAPGWRDRTRSRTGTHAGIRTDSDSCPAGVDGDFSAPVFASAFSSALARLKRVLKSVPVAGAASLCVAQRKRALLNYRTTCRRRSWNTSWRSSPAL